MPGIVSEARPRDEVVLSGVLDLNDAMEVQLKSLPELQIPSIPPIDCDTVRPFWSVMIVPRHDPGALAELLAELLSQDPGPQHMQIEVVEDASENDENREVVKSVGSGRIGYYRQARRAGAIANRLTCLLRSRGRWIHLLDGTDQVARNFYSEYERLIEQYSDATLLTGPPTSAIGTTAKEADGRPWPDFVVRQARYNRVAAPTAVVPRCIYEQIGGFALNLEIATANWEFWFRAGMAGRVVAAPKAFASVRDLRIPRNAQDDAALPMAASRDVAELLNRRLPERNRIHLPGPQFQLRHSIATVSSFFRACRPDRGIRDFRTVVGKLRYYPWTGGRISSWLTNRSNAKNANGHAPRDSADMNTGAVAPPPPHAQLTEMALALARDRGIKVEFTPNEIAVTRDREEIRISTSHVVYLHDMVNYFDYYYSAVMPEERDGRRVADYSGPRLHRLRVSNVEFEFPSLPESDESTEAYLRALSLRPGDAVLDIGAYAGASAYFISKSVGPEGTVAAFEPDPLSMKYLRANVSRHGLSNVKAFDKGVWCETKTLSFQSEGNLGSSVVQLLDRDSQTRVISVVTLEDAAKLAGVDRITAIKMDIEGAEVAVLRYAGDFLRRHRPRLVIEPHAISGRMTTDPVSDILRDAGYAVEIVSQGLQNWPLVVGRPL